MPTIDNRLQAIEKALATRAPDLGPGDVLWVDLRDPDSRFWWVETTEAMAGELDGYKAAVLLFDDPRPPVCGPGPGMVKNGNT